MAELSGTQQFLNYLKLLPTACLQKLYESSATCIAILRYVPALDQQFIMRMALVEQPVSITIIESWMNTKNKKESQTTLENLKRLDLTQESNSFVKGICLSPAFRNGLKKAILSGKLSGLEEVAVDEKHRKTPADLSAYGTERWECILKYMALPSAETQKAVSQENRQVLHSAGFVTTDSQNETPEITSAGFKFLLTDRTSQLWIYLLNYLKYLESKSLSIIEPLTFLFHLSFCTLGKAYSSRILSDYMEDFLQQLREVGIVFQRKRKTGWFYPTPLAISLSSSLTGDPSTSTQSVMTNSRGGFLVVETNYRVYAYTESTLQLAIVSTFTDMMYRFGNLSVGILTRESVRKALQVGITSKQIADYMKCNAHEMMLNNPTVIPPVICDQLRLWELERDRFQFDDGALYSNFLSDAEFLNFRTHAESCDLLLWENPANRLLVIKKSGIEKMKDYWKQIKA